MKRFEVRVKIKDRVVECFKIKAENKEEALRICKEKYKTVYYIYPPLQDKHSVL